MKKLTALMLSLLLLASCAPPETVPPDDTSASPPPTPTYTAVTPAPTPEPPPEPEPSPEPEPFEITKENLPRIDTSTATIPLAEALIYTLTGNENTDELYQSNGTSSAWRNLIYDKADLALVYEASAKTKESYTKQWPDLEYKPIGRDALVFYVNESNPVDNITTDQIREIYTDKITNWSSIGGKKGEIIPYSRNAEAGSQALMELLVMGSEPLSGRTSNFVLGDMIGMVEAVASYENKENAIGYNVYYYIDVMMKTPGIKLLSIDGVYPTRETIADGTYPLTSDFYAAIRADTGTNSVTRAIYDWLTTTEGQQLVDMAGYVTIEPLLYLKVNHEKVVKSNTPTEWALSVQPPDSYTVSTVLTYRDFFVREYTSYYPKFSTLKGKGADAIRKHYADKVAELLKDPPVFNMEDELAAGSQMQQYNYEVTYYHIETVDNYVVVSFGSEWYGGGMHGGYTITVDNFDATTGRLLTLDDLFGDPANPTATLAEAPYYERINAEICAALVEHGYDGFFFDPTTETDILARCYDEHQFYIAANGITFIFGQYAIASYADGIQFITIPYESIADILKITPPNDVSQKNTNNRTYGNTVMTSFYAAKYPEG